jgi:MFS family permease
MPNPDALATHDSPPTTHDSPDRPWLAAVAVVPILATVYQTLVLTDVTDDVIRKGIEAEHYSMIWTTLCWGVATLYGVFAGLWAMPRFGSRDTLSVGLILFALGNLLCGASFDVASMSAARLVEGLGKGMTIVLCRAMLYRQFDRMVMVAIGIYGIIAYSSRPTTPLLTAVVNDYLSWQWIYWVNVPITLLGLVLVKRFVKPDRPPKPLLLRIDWLAVTLLALWVICLLFVFAWYRKWGGWTSDAWAVTAILAVALPVVLGIWVGAGFTPDEHLRRMFRVRGYVLAMCVRMLLLLQLGAFLTVMSKYLTGVRDYPRAEAGWLLAPGTLTMAVSTFLTTYFHRKSLRHFWLLVGVLGTSVCLWHISSFDLFTPRHHIALMLGCWGLFLGLFPPAFLTDEVEALDRRDALYGGALAVIFLIIPLVVVPTMASTVISAWSDRAVDAERMNLRAERPAVSESTARIADYYHQRGVAGAEVSQRSGTVLGAYVQMESAVRGVQAGFAFLSLLTGGMGVVVSILLWRAIPGKAK